MPAAMIGPFAFASGVRAALARPRLEITSRAASYAAAGAKVGDGGTW